MKMWFPMLMLFFIQHAYASSDRNVTVLQTITRLPDTLAAKPVLRISGIVAPAGYKRIPLPVHSFGTWLRHQPLRHDKILRLYNGQPLPRQTHHYAVLDINIGRQNLLQCADAIIYFRASFLYQSKGHGAIVFTDDKGKRHQLPAVANARTFQRYLHTVFAYCNTASLAKQMKPIAMHELMPGDVWLRGGFPGHGAIVADMCENARGEKLYLLVQGFMPAQNIHVLRNFYEPSISPWYRLHRSYHTIYTPTYWFNSTEAKRF
jgi:hypothetical protein